MTTAAKPPTPPDRVRRPASLDDPLLDFREAAALLGLAPATIYSWCSRRLIPSVKIRGALRFRESDLRNLIRAGLRPAVPQQDSSSLLAEGRKGGQQ